ncbi:hypothetical protein T260_15140 [Geobacillus thermopakistaniensis]|uniref:Fibronectin type-III domain-containing protein n=1 Tax=Geobacillus thermopakistaniensis (strain MAS1) TaxID=1408282 RepID=A0A7U9J8Y5_GEOTM|nr:DNRLRE domain-containing protein [Geobacillus sp. MAS1]ESU71177.1 hypothetical protein T260_15140 [Geobacillus sp. MAS1]
MPTQNFRVGELLNKRTRNSKTWINFDGSYTTEIYAGDVHYQDENGNWHNIDTDLYDEADLDQIDFPVAKEGADVFRVMKDAAQRMKKKNILDRDMMDYQGLKVPFDCRIPKNFRRGYTVGKGKNKLRFVPVGASPAKGYMEEGKKNCIHYQDVWNDTDVCLEVMPNGVKETIILKSDRAPSSFSFEVDGPLEDDLTAGNLKLQPAWLVDANGERRDVAQTIRREGDKTYIDLVADVTGLVYPIEIDPTVTIQPDSTTSKDTYVDSYSPNATPYNASFARFGYYLNNSQKYRAYLQFDVSQIPAGAVVTSALLGLQISGESNNAPYSYLIHRVTSSWSQTNLSWNNQPSFDTTTSIQYDTTGSILDTNISIEIKDFVNLWLSGTPNYGIVIKDKVEGGYSWKEFCTSEHSTVSYRPKLTITYNLPPTAPTVTAPNGGETWNAQHTITWSPATDQDDPSSTEKIYNNTENGIFYINSGDWVSQEFTIDKDYGYLSSVRMTFASINGGVVKISLTNSVGGQPGSTVYEAKNVTIPASSSYYAVTLPLTTKLKFSVGTKLCIKVEFISGSANDIQVRYNSSDATYSGGSLYHKQGSNNPILKGDALFGVAFTEATPQNMLQYHIQLSTNNGQSWKDIVTLTSPGATSYTYDFTNEPETSLAKIRIRAYDGTSYGPWDESNGVFTIQHNQAPTVPTNLSPSGGTPRDRASIIRLSWQHNDANGDPQAKFDLQWRQQGAQTWNTVTQVTTNQYWDAPANTFPRGTIEWQVRTYDQAGLSSPYSNIQTFFAGDKPTSPTITDPSNGATVPVANPVVQWSSVGQTAYHVKLLDVNDTLLWEAQVTSTNKAQTIQYNLANNTDYKIQVAIQNADNLWSDFVTVNIHVSYTPPAVPIVSTTKGEGIITITIDNPTPTGTQPNVSYNEVYRRKQGESTWTRIATNIPADTSFVDYTPASGQVYEYFVRAWGTNGTYADSLIVSRSISLQGIWLHEADNPLATLHQFKLVSDRSENWQPTAAMMQFAGRRLPVAEYDDTEQRTISMKITVLKNSDDREAIERLIRSKNTLCYRDGRGRKMFCHAFQLPVDDEVYGNTVSLTFEEVSYSEEV